VIAEHAAEALVALKRADATRGLLAAFEAPDPKAPYPKKGAGAARFVKEVVRINHRHNCLMCHPASTATADQPRKVVPSADELAGRSLGLGYGLGAGLGLLTSSPKERTFVRADITFLKQDYSVMLAGERFDLFVRERLATAKDVSAALARKRKGRSPQQAAAAFALRELTGQGPGPANENWFRFAMNHHP
jgi:hypothetical protein